MKRSFCVLFVLLIALPSLAYEFKANQWLLRGVVGKAVYFAQDPSTKIGAGDSLGGNILTGLEVDYLITKKTAVTAAFRPNFATNRVVLNFGVGAKYRCVKKDVPIIPFFTLSLVPSVLIPTNAFSDPHFNLGLRPTMGFEYFIARDLAIGLEAGFTPSLLWGKGTANTFEATFEVLVGATWRL